MVESKRLIKKRNLVVISFMLVLTFGFYGIYWLVSTKREINSVGGDIPNSFLMFVPVIGLYWVFKYFENFAVHIQNKHAAGLYFIIYLVSSAMVIFSNKGSNILFSSIVLAITLLLYLSGLLYIQNEINKFASQINSDDSGSGMVKTVSQIEP